VNDSAWWKNAFTDHYQSLYAHRDDASAAQEIAGLIPRLAQLSGPVLDMGCGNGRHLTALREAGIHAYGCDYSAVLVRSAKQRPTCTGKVIRGDMRHPAIADGWGAVLMLFTAFGYFSHEQNSDCLGELARLLVPGGWLLLDLPDPEVLARTLVPFSQRQLADGRLVEETRRLHAGRVEKNIVIRQGQVVTQRYGESVALYDRSAMATLAAANGLFVSEVWTSLLGPQHDAQRLVFWLQRK
jgi:SAM-dependent methyltransferase